MKDVRPLVSVLINNYNYGRFLRDAIDSALKQTYLNTEVIVVDDGSTDNSLEIIASYGRRIIAVLKENGGQASAFNAGFARSQGDIIGLLDSDDIFLPNKVQEVVNLAMRNPEAGLIAHNLEYFSADGAPIDFLPPAIKKCKLVDDRRRVRRGGITAVLPATSGLCFRRKVLGHVLPMPEELKGQPDNYIKFAALSVSPALLAPKCLAKQRIHECNHYTPCYKDNSEATLLRRLILSAEVGFHLRREQPQLSRLAWRQYGRILYQLHRSRSAEARALKSEIQERFNVVDGSPGCLSQVAGAYAKALLRDMARSGNHG